MTARKSLMPLALLELSKLVDARLLVRLELHVPLRMHIRQRDWNTLFSQFIAVRYLCIGGERTVRKVLAAKRSTAARLLPVIPPLLAELSFCVHRVTRTTLNTVGDRFGGRGIVVLFRLLERSHRSEQRAGPCGVPEDEPEITRRTRRVRASLLDVLHHSRLSFAERMRIEREEAMDHRAALGAADDEEPALPRNEDDVSELSEEFEYIIVYVIVDAMAGLSRRTTHSLTAGHGGNLDNCKSKSGPAMEKRPSCLKILYRIGQMETLRTKEHMQTTSATSPHTFSATGWTKTITR
ncbi:hypothetical protein PYCCODRAFT_1473727 [Trametes coccinea BRFM310]|uniref:Uncharacterized protein n=1 Tax=Trametes coccinea (strain BRFM310) TaxID=1353009 RepID=A0A1Y2J486_TRAC3|nr:hypothetical protein PYCCODRAFT_1473727 [Trametes coccinea BRFM310]